MKTSNRLLLSCAAVALILVLAWSWQSRGRRDDTARRPAAAPSLPAAKNTLAAKQARPVVPLLSSPPTLSAPAAPVAVSPIAAFNSWSEKFLAATPEQKAGSLAEGEQLAKARRDQMRELIKNNPREALAQELPYRVRKDLPASFGPLLEQRVSGRGDYDVLVSDPLSGEEADADQIQRQVTLRGRTYEAYPFGTRLRQTTAKGLALSGIVIENLMALDPSPGHVVDPDEAQVRIDAGQVPAHPICTFSGQPIIGKPTLLDLGGMILPVCNRSEAMHLSGQLAAAESATGLLGDTGGIPNPTNPPPGTVLRFTQGRRTVLFIRLIFPDDPTEPISESAANQMWEGVNQFFVDGSYNTLTFMATVTPLITLPQTKEWYGNAGPGTLLTDAQTAARAAGFDYLLFDDDVLGFTPVPKFKFGGLAFVGARGVWLQGFGVGIAAHELGHNLGLLHANFWDTRQPQGPPPNPNAPMPNFPIDPDSDIGHDAVNAPGTNVEYGDPYDTMGSGGPQQYNALHKYQLHWLPAEFVHPVTVSETNRLFAFDTPTLTTGRLYALHLRKDAQGFSDRSGIPNGGIGEQGNPIGARDYWVDYRQLIPNNFFLANGVELHWSPWPGTDGSSQLVDTTPGTPDGASNAPVLIGRTFVDEALDLYLTPVAKGGTGLEKWIDVVVQYGPFPSNAPPAVDLTASSLAVSIGATVTFVANASDPNGDPLAYYWDFGDQSFGINSPTNSKTFRTPGNFAVRCEVSDLKGGLTSAYVLVRVGSPTNYTISGQVMDDNGNPVQGARVHNGNVPPNAPYRYTFTDSQGNYTITGLDPGNYLVETFLYGYKSSPPFLDFINPIPIFNADAFNVDHILTQVPRVSVSVVSDALEASGSPGVFKISRTGNVAQDLSVYYKLSGSATINEYQPPPNNPVVIPAGSTSANLQIVPTNDGQGLGPETLTLTLMPATNDIRLSTVVTNVATTNMTNQVIITVTNMVNVPGWELVPVNPPLPVWFQTPPVYVMGGKAEATMKIVEATAPGRPSVSVIPVDDAAVETGNDSAVVLFTRMGSAQTDLVVHYTLSGTASNGVDYVALPGIITIPAGQSFAVLPIVAINDLFVEGNETVILTIAADPAYDIGGSASATVFIVDDDLPLVTLTATRLNADAANGTSGAFTVSRSGSLDRELLVNYLVTGTAINGVDYQTLSGSVIIPAGGVNADIVVSPISNPLQSQTTTVTAFISSSPTYDVGTPNSATVFIQDDNLPTVNLQLTAAAAAEPNTPGLLTITSTKVLPGDLTVNFQVGGTAIELADYAAIGTKAVIPAGATSTTITISPLDDPFRELQETVIVQLLPGTNYYLGTNTIGTVTIDDNDSANLPAVGFLLKSSSVLESDGQALIGVGISASPNTNNAPVIVEYHITGGSAVNGTNYSLSSTGYVTFYHVDPPVTSSDLITNLNVTILDDMVAGPNKTLLLTLFNPNLILTNVTTNVTMMGTNIVTNLVAAATNAFLGVYRTHTLTIVDDDLNVVTITATNGLAYEGGPVPSAFLISRTGSASRPLTVTFEVTDTASERTDIVALGNTVTIPAGTNSVLLPVLPIENGTEEVAETVTVELISAPQSKIGTPSIATIVIVDNDGTIQFTSADFQVSESNAVALITVQRTGPTNRAVTVDYVIQDGTAIRGRDYNATNGTLAFAPGETIKSFPVYIVNDTLVEPTETVRLLLTNPTGGVPLGGQNRATLEILDDDSNFQFATPSFTVNENVTNAVINISRVGLTNFPASVTFFTSDGTATNNLDYLGTNVTLNFAPGDTNKTVLVKILDDILIEGDETVNLVLTNATGGAALGTNSATTLLIRDDDCSLEFASPTNSVWEFAGAVAVEVRRNGGAINTVSVNYTTRDGTAASTGPTPRFVAASGKLTFQGEQFVASTNGGGLVFQPGETNKTIFITILDDNIGNGLGTFSVILSNALVVPASAALPGSARLGTTTNEVVTILDDETPGNVDFDYNSGLGPNDVVRAVALQPDLSLVFGGDFTTVNAVIFNHISRLQANGVLDTSFNPGTGADDIVYAVASQSDGKVLLGGAFANVHSASRPAIARLNADGSLDTSFAPGSGANNVVRAIAVQADGNILIGGDFTLVNGAARNRLARLKPDGSVDSSFSPAFNSPVYALAIQPDGNILVGGAFSTVNAVARSGIVRLTTNGVVDATFDPGSGAAAPVNAVAVQPSGLILVGGRFTAFGGTSANYLARLNTNGAVDATFNSGSGPDAPVNALAVDPNGKIVIGGDFTSFNGVSRNRYARLRSDGSLDTVFNTGTGANAAVRAVSVQPDTAAIIGGDFTQVNGLPRNHLARIHGDEKSNLALVEFNPASYAVSELDGFATITVERSGNTNVAFNVSFGTTNGTALAGVDYVTTNGVLMFAVGEIRKTFDVQILEDSTIEPLETVNLFLNNAPPSVDLSGASTGVLRIVEDDRSIQFSATNYSVVESGTNAVVTLLRFGVLTGAVSVTFTTSDGTAVAGLDYLSVSNVIVFADGQSSQTVLVPIIDDSVRDANKTLFLTLSNPSGGALLGPAGATVTIIDDNPGPGGVDQSFKPGAGANDFVRSVALQPNGKIVLGGGFTMFDNLSRNYVTRLNTNGAQDLSFDPGAGANALVASVSSLPDGKVALGGAFTNINGIGYNHVARLNTNGSPDLNFNQRIDFDASVNVVLAGTNARVLAAGGFSLPTHGIAQLRPDSSLDVTFDPGGGANGPVHCLIGQPDGSIILGGAFTTFNGDPRSGLARISANGLVDETFVPAAIAGGTVYSLALQADGKVFIGGDFTSVSGADRHGIARLNTDGSLDTGFDPGSGVNAAVFAIGVQASGNVIIGGDFTSFNGMNRFRYARLLPNGVLDPAFNSTSGANSTVYALAIQPNQDVIIAGDFTMVDGQPRNGVARIKADDRGLQIMGFSLVGGQATITVSSQPGLIYVLEASTDLVNWTVINTMTASGTTLTFTDFSASGFNQRFYRVRLGP